MSLSRKRICSGNCKKFKVSKPHGVGGCRAGQGRCQICDIWLDYRGAHTKDGKPATASSVGWYCNCCNYRIRRNPRSINYKAKIKRSRSDKVYEDNIDLSYFDKHRARMLRDLGRAIVEKESKNSAKHCDSFLPTGSKSDDIESEFNTRLDRLIKLTKTVDPPNKISVIVEFERIRHVLKRTPTKQDIGHHSALQVSEYEDEFGSWEHLLDMLGYDPWYTHDRNPPAIDSKHISPEEPDWPLEMVSTMLPAIDSKHISQEESDSTMPVNRKETPDRTRKKIADRLKNDPDMLRVLVFLEQNIPTMSLSGIRSLLSSLSDD